MYVLTTAKLNATGHCWLAALASFNFDISYRPGKANTDADILSHRRITQESINIIEEAVSKGKPLVETICLSAQVEIQA